MTVYTGTDALYFFLNPFSSKAHTALKLSVLKWCVRRFSVFNSPSVAEDSVKRKSMNTLLPNTWLCDEPLNFYMNKVINNMDKRRCREHPTRRRSHCFRSFFFTNALGHNNIYDYERVKNHGNFVPGRNMFDLKYLFFPYNYKNVHWNGVAVFVEEKRIKYDD